MSSIIKVFLYSTLPYLDPGRFSAYTYSFFDAGILFFLITTMIIVNSETHAEHTHSCPALAHQMLQKGRHFVSA